MRGARREQPVEPAAEHRAGDLARIALADRTDVGGVHDAAAQERQPAVEVERIARVRRHADGVGDRMREQPLVGQIVDRQQRRRAIAGPVRVAGGERARPVVEVQQVRPPGQTGAAAGDLRRRAREGGEADRVVLPLAAFGIDVGRAFAFVQRRAQQHVHAQPVAALDITDQRLRQLRMRAHAADQPHVPGLRQHRGVSRNQHPHVRLRAQRARQRRGHVAQAAGLDEIGHLRGHEQTAPARTAGGTTLAAVAAGDADRGLRTRPRRQSGCRVGRGGDVGSGRGAHGGSGLGRGRRRDRLRATGTRPMTEGSSSRKKESRCRAITLRSDWSKVSESARRFLSGLNRAGYGCA